MRYFSIFLILWSNSIVAQKLIVSGTIFNSDSIYLYEISYTNLKPQIDSLLKATKGEYSFFMDHCVLLKDKYIVSPIGGIFNLHSNKEFFPIKKNECLVKHQKNNDSLIYHFRNCFFDYNKKELVLQLDSSNFFIGFDIGENMFFMPDTGDILPIGILNSNQKYGISYDFNTKETRLHSFMLTKKSLGKRFGAEVINFMEERVPPFLWITDSTFLTQISNGEIVIVNLEGSYKKVLSINDAKEGIYNAPNLFFDSDSNIIYEFEINKSSKNKFKAKEKRVKLDLKNKQYAEYEPVFSQNNFKNKLLKNNTIEISYNGENIGKTKMGSMIKTIDDCIAIKEVKKKKSIVKVWTKETQKWHILKFNNQISLIGWAKKQ